MVKIFTLRYSIRLSGFDTTNFDDFIRDKTIVDIREYFFIHDSQPHLAILVLYQPVGAPIANQQSQTMHKDTTGVAFTDADIPLFNKLKEWRNELAKAKGIPPYIMFNNKQLAAIAHARPTSKTALIKIEGIGDKKADEYWEELNRLLKPQPDATANQDQSNESSRQTA